MQNRFRLEDEAHPELELPFRIGVCKTSLMRKEGTGRCCSVAVDVVENYEVGMIESIECIDAEVEVALSPGLTIFPSDKSTLKCFGLWKVCSHVSWPVDTARPTWSNNPDHSPHASSFGNAHQGA